MSGFVLTRYIHNFVIYVVLTEEYLRQSGIKTQYQKKIHH